MFESLIVVWLTLPAVTPAPSASQPASLPPAVDVLLLEGLPTQHDGRWPPLDTVARETVESVTGEAFYQGRHPLLWLLAWTFAPQTFKQVPLITIRSPALRAELRLPAERSIFSYAELVKHGPLIDLIEELSPREPDRKMNPLEAKVNDLSEKLGLLHEVFAGEVIRLIPDGTDATGAWRPIVLPDGSEPGPTQAVTDAWAALKKAFLANNGPAFRTASERLASILAGLPAAHRPDGRLLVAELRYNRLHPFGLAWKVSALGAFLGAVAMALRRRVLDSLALLAILAGFATLTYGLVLRWQIAGRIPAANMFESLLFVGWGAGAFAVAAMLLARNRLTPWTASLLGALALFLADVLPLDHYIRPIAPLLLDTIWMSIHVPVVMVSYAVLALAMLIAHIQLVAMAVKPDRPQLIAEIDTLHRWYLHAGTVLLAMGIITGSMWASSSWGRYWGWDPKEVWSLIAFLGYLAILHVRVDRERLAPWVLVLGSVLAIGLAVIVVPKLAPLTPTKVLALASAGIMMLFFVLTRGPLAMAVKSMAAFWLIIMTYVGVNYVLGTGLHSYGFGTGAVVHYMFLVGGFDLGLIALFSAIYVVRCGWRAGVYAR